MIISVVSLKGGVGKTTTAIHLAAYLQHQASTLLIDADPNRAAIAWSKRGHLPFEVVDESRSPATPSDHVVIDAPARLIPEELTVLAESCDLIVLPTTIDVMALDVLVLLLEQLSAISVSHYRVLLTFIPSRPSRDVDQVRSLLASSEVPLFQTGIRGLAAFQKAAQAGQLVSDVKDPRAPDGWQDYQQVGQELIALFGL
jgi:chromosome partitioning protein